MIRRRMLGAYSRFIGVVRGVFLLFLPHKCHYAFRAIAGMIRDHFGMHRAGVLLFFLLLLLVIVLATRAIEVNRPYLRTYRERKCAD